MRPQGTVRAGRYVRTLPGYQAFVPAPLPPDPPIATDDPELQVLLANAALELGRLDMLGAPGVLPNPDLFVAAYVRKEAVLSSQIEGTQASLLDVFEYEANGGREALGDDVAEVVNHVRAMNHGLKRLATLPLSLRLIREIHAELMTGVRGAQRQPGEFRTSQNWIGPPGATLSEAQFVPPHPDDMRQALADLEKFLHDESPMPPLVKVALIHSQFETIHPFLDGNGRIGRLLITFYLCQQGVLRRPLLYISHFFRKHRVEYYERLQAVRDDGDWEGWVEFFLRGVTDVAREATETASEILAMRAEHQAIAATFKTRGAGALVDQLCERPVVSIPQVAERVAVSFPTAGKLVERFVEAGLLTVIPGVQHPRLFVYAPYVALLAEGTIPEGDQPTHSKPGDTTAPQALGRRERPFEDS